MSREQAGICFCCIIYTFFRIPEPRGRTFAELDVLFERRVNARKFAKTEVDVFHEVVEEKVMDQFEKVVHTNDERVRGTA
jgi:MFS transporter, SP family, general alpha glucoside:H+ symporter